MSNGSGPAHQRLDIVLSFGTPLQICEIEPEPKVYSFITIWFEQFKITAKGDVMYTLPVDKAVKMQVSYVDAEDNPATVDGDVEWESSDEDIAQLSVDSDTTIVTVIPVGKAGQVQITATADADLGQGTRNLITTCDISIVAGEAVAGTIAPVGEPVDKP